MKTGVGTPRAHVYRQVEVRQVAHDAWLRMSRDAHVTATAARVPAMRGRRSDGCSAAVDDGVPDASAVDVIGKDQ